MRNQSSVSGDGAADDWREDSDINKNPFGRSSDGIEKLSSINRICFIRG